MKKPLSLTAKININLHQKLSFSPLFGKIFSAGGNTAFFPGCSMAAYNTKLTLNVYHYLQKLFPGLALVTLCCGDPSRSLDKQAFVQRQQFLAEQFKRYHIQKLIVCCPNCQKNFTGFRDLEIIPIWQILAEHLPENKNCWQDFPSFMLHDPCPIRHDIQTQNKVREILTQIGFPYQEYTACRQKTICCGKKDMLMVRDRPTALKILAKSINRSPNKHIVSYCFSCVESFRSAGCQAIHLLEILFLDQTSLSAKPSVNSLWRSWLNRYLLAHKVKNHETTKTS